VEQWSRRAGEACRFLNLLRQLIYCSRLPCSIDQSEQENRRAGDSRGGRWFLKREGVESDFKQLFILRLSEKRNRISDIYTR